MELSIFYDHIVRGAQQHGMSMPDALAQVRAMGYTRVDINVSNLWDDPAVLPMLREAGLGLSAVFCFFNFEKEPQEERIRAFVDTAAEAGAGRIMPIPGFHQEGGDPQEDLARMLKGMALLCELAQAKGLEVTIEDFDNAASPIRDSKGMRYFLDRLPRLMVTFDTGNFYYSCEDELSAFDALADRVVHAHLKDRALQEGYGPSNITAMDGRKLYPCPVGQGDVKIREILHRMTAQGYDGVLSIEHYGCDDMLAAMEESAVYVRRCLAEM